MAVRWVMFGAIECGATMLVQYGITLNPSRPDLAIGVGDLSAFLSNSVGSPYPAW